MSASSVRRVLLGAAALAPLAGLTSCGGVTAADLFVVTRTGPAPAQRLTILVNEEGVVRCDNGPILKLSDPQLVQARAIQEELRTPASERLSLPPRPGSVYSYAVRDENGTVSFSDNSASQPHVLHELALFVLQVAQQVCRVPE
ncbi:MAG TPA: hypothetical protein VKG82_01495 [Solirubrobacteraceae bacterium]|nr:hypothetical protein [Solirubrobacteraceae bacterium]